MDTRRLHRAISALVFLAMASARITNAGGADIASVTFQQAPAGVLVPVDVTGLPSGGHGIHLHAVGSCSPDFKASGGHINPDDVPHGLLGPGGGDSGDVPNLHVAADGSAVIIHDSPDDHMTQPIGGAGGRIACGVIEGM